MRGAKEARLRLGGLARAGFVGVDPRFEMPTLACFRKFGTAPNVTINFPEVKVKLQGQNRRTENLTVAIARLQFKISSSK